MTGITAPSGRASFRSPMRTVLVATVAIVLVVLAGSLVRNVLIHDDSAPAFEPRPLPGSTHFAAKLAPGVSYRIPSTHVASPDDAGLTVVRFDGVPTGALVAMRVKAFPSGYPAGDKHDLAAAVAADDRLQVLNRTTTTVAGTPATRLVVRPRPGITAAPWFCPNSNDPCFDLDPTGRTTLYLFEQHGTRYLLSGGAVNDSGANRLRPIVDGAAATWTW